MSISNTNTKIINIAAIGGVSKILANFNKNQNLFALETAQNNLSALPDHINKILFGPGNGSGGNPEFAASLFDESLVEPIFDCDLLILIAGLGGGTGSGITPKLAQMAKEKGVLTKIIAFSPRAVDGAKSKADQVLENFKSFGLPITLIDNQQILEKMPKTTNLIDFWKVANFGAQETVSSIKSILETQNIDFNDLKKTFDYGGFCYSNSGSGKDFKSAFDSLDSTMTIDPEQFKTAKGFLLNYKINKSGMTLEQLDEVWDKIKLVQSFSQADLKTNEFEIESGDFEITILVSGIGTQTKIDQNYSKIIQEKAENERAKYLSEVRSQSAQQKTKN